MVALESDRLVFRFPEVHPQARLTITFMRTLRIPDDGAEHPLPAGLGAFPIRHVDDYATLVPPGWREHGGVMLPMYQSEALWIDFEADYPFAIKVATGKINAVSGDAWRPGLHRDPQDYLVIPEQPWLDGYAVDKGIIRQFVAAPLGSGVTVEEQLTGKAEFGGMQLAAYPMKREANNRYHVSEDAWRLTSPLCMCCESTPEMGLAAGGKMRQEIAEDQYELTDWDLETTSRCFVHICNSMAWREITRAQPPTVPPTAKEYENAGLPWFLYYDESVTPLPGAAKLHGIKSADEMAAGKETAS